MPTSAPTAAAPAADAGTASGSRLRNDPWVWCLLAAVAALLASSWWRQEGYQIADSVEYLERARGIAYGEQLIDSVAIRAFGFSGLLVPIFWVYDWLGIDGPVRIMQAAQLLQVCLTLALVLAVVRLGTRFVDRASGLCAGALLGFNPIVMRWGVEPVSGIAAALFVTLAIEALLGQRKLDARADASLPRQPLRQGWVAGLWLGLAFLMAYQTIPIAGAALIVVTLRDWRTNRGFPATVAASFAAIVLLQCGLDAAYYGSFGISVSNYFLENFGSLAALVLHKCGKLPLIGEWCYRTSYAIYAALYDEGSGALAYQAKVIAGTAEIKSKQPNDWYFTHITDLFAWPALICCILGLVRLALRSFRASALLWCVVAVNVAAMSLKGAKDFRLWLPFLPLLALFGAVGLTAIPWRGRAARACTVLLLGCVALLAVREFRAMNTRKFGGFWRAMAMVNERAAAERSLRNPPPAPGEEPAPTVKLRSSAAYHWSMFLRESADVELVKLPHHLDGWKSYDDAARQADFDTLATLDAFVTHLPVLTENPDLFEVINRDFAIAGAFYDRVVYDSLGPIYVLERRGPDGGGNRFYERLDPASSAAVESSRGGASRLEFAKEVDGVRESIALLEARYTPLAGDGHGWIRYTWRGGPLSGADWWILDRLTAPDAKNSWQNNHRPGYGMLATPTWGAGELVREGYLVVAEKDPFQPDVVHHPLGGDYLRGDLLPVTLWIDVVRLDEAKNVVERMPAHDARGERVDEAAPTPDLATPSGATTSRDGMTRAAAMFLAVHPSARLADDGRPVAAPKR